jgi:flagellum-specific peptidoglycan hydrolase FlgJ
MSALAVVFLLRHGITIDIYIGQPDDIATSEQQDQAAPPQAEARLASFSHSVNLSKKEVTRLRRSYISTYAPIAQQEMRAHGIPASITLAQGLLESVAGTSKLAQTTNNHFGIKCFARSCKKGHCTNYADDHHKDFFRVYTDPAQSFRDHSKFLVAGSRYARLFDLKASDYKGWAKGLKEAGYATDPGYADKLIGLIERYDLHKYDRI